MSEHDGSETGETCSLCGTDHDGYPPDTAGATLRCARVLAAVTGDTGLAEQVERVDSMIRGPQEALVRDILTWRDEDR